MIISIIIVLLPLVFLFILFQCNVYKFYCNVYKFTVTYCTFVVPLSEYFAWIHGA